MKVFFIKKNVVRFRAYDFIIFLQGSEVKGKEMQTVNLRALSKQKVSLCVSVL